MTVTVQPRERIASIAASPVAEGALPPLWSNVPPLPLLELMLTSMLSILVWVKAVLINAPENWIAAQPSKKLEGKVARLEQLRQALLKFVPDEVLIKGKLVRLEQPNQVPIKFVPAAVFIKGKLVRKLCSLK